MDKISVRAYDLGGFGDTAGAMRVASHLQRIGKEVCIDAKSKTTLEKLKILNPDTSYQLGQDSQYSLHIDIAGFYKDERNQSRKDVPHHFTEDMDNPRNRRVEVPIYLKTGMLPNQLSTPIEFTHHSHQPMFYRPYREWDLPKPGERDARKQMVDALTKHSIIRFLTKYSSPRKVIESTDRIGFAHLSPQLQQLSSLDILEHPYFQVVHRASVNSDQSFGIGLFVGKELENNLTSVALLKYWNAVTSQGIIGRFDKTLPTLFFLGPQPQLITSGLFLSADIPNLVTGDLSLSDAMYGLIAMDGPAFLYETPVWKLPTLKALHELLGRHHPLLAEEFFLGSNFTQDMDEISSRRKKQLLDNLAYRFLIPGHTKSFTHSMKIALQTEIQRRFGPVQVEEHLSDGFYIPPGAPFLLQDATAKIITTLQEDSDALSEVEDVRKKIRNGVPLSISVKTGVLEENVPSQSNSAVVLDKYLSLGQYIYPKNNQYKGLEFLIQSYKNELPHQYFFKVSPGQDIDQKYSKGMGLDYLIQNSKN